MSRIPKEDFSLRGKPNGNSRSINPTLTERLELDINQSPPEFKNPY